MKTKQKQWKMHGLCVRSIFGVGTFFSFSKEGKREILLKQCNKAFSKIRFFALNLSIRPLSLGRLCECVCVVSVFFRFHLTLCIQIKTNAMLILLKSRLLSIDAFVFGKMLVNVWISVCTVKRQACVSVNEVRLKWFFFLWLFAQEYQFLFLFLFFFVS